LREEDKEEGEDLKGNLMFFFFVLENLKDREEGGSKEQWFWGTLTGHYCCWELRA
jgi:hypothetical protein